MQTVKALMNRSEEIVFQELERIASDNALRVFPKVRLSDVLEKRGKSLGSREFQFFARSHFDFVLATADFQPLMGIEYDGPSHNDARQIERDHIKNELCRKANFGLLRINSKHVTRLYRGMTLLRWIVEVSHLQECFDKALEEGTVPPDFDFDPLFVAGTGDGRNFPYWLSAPANQRVHKFIESLEQGTPRGWFSLSGKDGDEKICKLSYLYFGDKVITAFTSVRQQDICLPYYTLLDEINGCELGTRLSQFQSGELRPVGIDSFKATFERFCQRFNAHPSHSMGAHPFPASWNGREWK